MTLAGQVLEGKYRLVRLIGEGGMGYVYEGENIRILRRVAIKVLRREISGNAEVVRRFEREAQAAACIGSDHIVDVLDLGDLPDGSRYIVMEYLDGTPLSRLMRKEGPLATPRALGLIVQLLTGLGKAHDARIIHRDMKPENVFVIPKARGEHVKILDFGISKFTSDTNSMTRTGAVLGTPAYMSPEQVRGEAIDHRVDLYAVGTILFECLTAQLPFIAETHNHLFFKIGLEQARSITSVVPTADPALAEIVAKALARDRNARFRTAAEFADAISGWLARNAPDRGVRAGSVRPPHNPVSVAAFEYGTPPPQHVPNRREANAFQNAPSVGAGNYTPTPYTDAPPTPMVPTPQAWEGTEAPVASGTQGKTTALKVIVGAAATMVIAGGVLVLVLLTSGKTSDRNRDRAASGQPAPGLAAAPSAVGSAGDPAPTTSASAAVEVAVPPPSASASASPPASPAATPEPPTPKEAKADVPRSEPLPPGKPVDASNKTESLKSGRRIRSNL